MNVYDTVINNAMQWFFSQKHILLFVWRQDPKLESQDYFQDFDFNRQNRTFASSLFRVWEDHWIQD